MTKITKSIIFLTFVSAMIALSMAEIPKPAIKSKTPVKKLDISYLRYLDKTIKDTLYTTKKSYIEIDLKTQYAVVIMKTGERFRFPVSTGTNKLYQGVNTNEGIFTIFSKAEVAVSRDFFCNLYFWMQFNYGIGMHGLDGNGYYGYLGKEPSSHGCVRVSNEDIKIAFSMVELGAPVLVKSGDNNAVTISFADTMDSLLVKPKMEELTKLIKQRIYDLYAGNFEKLFAQKICIDNSNVGPGGLPFGDISKIPDSKALLYKSPIISTSLTNDRIKAPNTFIDDLAYTGTTKDTSKSKPKSNDTAITKK